MRAPIALVVAALVATGPIDALASQKEVAPAAEAAAFKEMAAAMPLGSRVRVQTAAGRRMTATLMSVTDDGIVVKRETRVPESAVAIRFDELARLQRDEKGRGLSVAKVIGIGLAAGAGAILTMLAIAFSFD